MNAKVNMQLLKTTSFDSSSLGPLGMVLHQFAQPGHYRGSALRNGEQAGEFQFDVDDSVQPGQLNIDLAAVERRVKSRPEDCDCADGSLPRQTVSPKGYVLFYTTSGDGYSATVIDDAGNTVFDSTKLGEGDVFAVTLLEPAEYSIAAGNATASAVVHQPEPGRRVAAAARTLEVKGKLDTDRVELVSTQGLVFRIQDGSEKVVIEKRGGAPAGAPKPSGEAGGRKPILQWRKL